MTTTELVEKIKRILVNPEGIDEESLRRLASNYAARSRRLNDKLERAVGCIKSGALCEADRIEREGRLIEEFQTLAFDRYDEWVAVCKSLGFDAAAPVSVDNGTELQLFIFAYDEVRELFARHRRLALTCAPIPQRLEALYPLLEKFPQCQTLLRSIDALEKERERELTDALNKKTEPITAEFAKQVLEELSSAARRNPPSEKLIQAYQKRYVKAMNAQTLETARNCLVEWAQAQLEENHKKMFECLDTYRTCGYANLLSELANDEQEAFQLLERETLALKRQEQTRTELRRKTRELARAVGSSYDPDKLANMLAETELMAENANMTLDKKTTQAAEERVETLALQRERRNKFLIAVAVGLLIMFSAAVFFVLAQTQNARKAKASAAIIENTLDKFSTNPERSDLLRDAEERANKDQKNNPKFLENPDYAAVIERLKSASENEKLRVENFKTEVSKVEAEHEKGNPYPTLTKLEKLAVTSEEKTLYNNLKNINKELKNNLDNQEKKRIEPALEKLREDVKKAIDAPSDQQYKLFSECRSSLSSLQNSITLSETEDYQQELDILKASIDTGLTATEQNKNDSQTAGNLTNQLKDAIESVSVYCDELNSVIDSLSENDRLLAQAAVADAQRVEILKSWNEIVKQELVAHEWLRNKELFDAIAELFENEDNEMNVAPEYSKITVLVDKWRDFGETGGLEGVKSALQSSLSKFSATAYLYYNPIEKRYVYLNKAPENNDDQEVKRYIDASGKTESFSSSVKTMTSEELQNIEEAYQYKVYQELQTRSPEKLQEFVDFIVENNIKNIVNESENHLDPGVKILLLDACFNALETFPDMKNVVDQYKSLRSKVNVAEDYDFYNIQSQKSAREEVKKILTEQESLIVELNKGLEKTKQSLQTPLATYHWVGFIDVAPKNTIVQKPDLQLAENAELWIFHGERAIADKCGSVKNGRAVINDDKDWANYRWSPVYERIEIPNE